MSNSESTAINELIDLVKRKPLQRDSDEDLLFEAPKAARLSRGTTAPPLFPVERPSEPTEVRATMPVISTRKQVFERTPRNEDELATVYIARQVPIDQALKKLALPLAGVLVGAITIGGIVSLAHRHHERHVDAPLAALAIAAPAQPIAAPPPSAATVTPAVAIVAPAVAPAPKLVEVRLESTPAGASATLVTNGASTPLGVTPVDAAVDPAKSYDVVFALEGRITKIEHLDPTATNHLAVALVAPTLLPEAPAAAVVAKKPARSHHHAAPKQAARVAVAAPSRSPAAPLAAKPGAPAATGNGSLMVKTTPPCAILIDGKNTGLTSPQAAIALPPGAHQVRLIAATSHVNKLIAVEITPRHTTKLVQTFDK